MNDTEKRGFGAPQTFDSGKPFTGCVTLSDLSLFLCRLGLCVSKVNGSTWNTSRPHWVHFLDWCVINSPETWAFQLFPTFHGENIQTQKHWNQLLVFLILDSSLSTPPTLTLAWGRTAFPPSCLFPPLLPLYNIVVKMIEHFNPAVLS